MKKTYRFSKNLLLLALCVYLSSCSILVKPSINLDVKKLEGVQEGMSKTQVEEVLGEPRKYGTLVKENIIYDVAGYANSSGKLSLFKSELEATVVFARYHDDILVEFGFEKGKVMDTIKVSEITSDFEKTISIGNAEYISILKVMGAPHFTGKLLNQDNKFISGWLVSIKEDEASEIRMGFSKRGKLTFFESIASTKNDIEALFSIMKTIAPELKDYDFVGAFLLGSEHKKGIEDAEIENLVLSKQKNVSYFVDQLGRRSSIGIYKDVDNEALIESLWVSMNVVEGKPKASNADAETDGGITIGVKGFVLKILHDESGEIKEAEVIYF